MVICINSVANCILEMSLSERGGFRDHFGTKIIDLSQSVQILLGFARKKWLILMRTNGLK